MSCGNARAALTVQSQTQLLHWNNHLFLIILTHGGWFPRLVSDFDNQILYRNLHHLNPSD